MVPGSYRPYQLSTRVVAALFLCASAYVVAHTLNAWVADSLASPAYSSMVEEVAAQPEFREDAITGAGERFAQDILASGLFALPAVPSRLTATVPVAPQSVPMNLSSKVALIGVVTGADGTGWAILEEVPGKKQALYRVAQRVPDVGELTAIESTRVLFREGAQEEWLDLAIVKQTESAGRFPIVEPQAQTALPPSTVARPPARRGIDRAQIVQLVSNPEAYAAEARFQPHFDARGQVDGFRVDGIRQVGVLERAGLQNDDVLSMVNGVAVRDPARLWEVFKQLQHERVIRLNVLRQSQLMAWVVEIRG